METNKKHIGERIKNALTARKIKQIDLSKLTYLPESTTSLIISGDRMASADKLAKIAAVLNVSLDWLITGKEHQLKDAVKPTEEDALRMVLTSKPDLIEKIKGDLRQQVREEMQAYTNNSEEQRLLDAYRNAEEVIKGEAMGMLIRSAERSEGRGGGTKNLMRSNGE